MKVLKECPYVSTIKRHLLDFDYEKFCSVSLSNVNIYACLCCGKYFQGRGKNTYCYFHALENYHHLFINLLDSKVYCMPENYEFDHVCLKDIKFNLKPTYKIEDIKKMDQSTKYSKSLEGTEYLPGCTGLNNIKSTDFVNVIIQSFCRIKDLRDFFLFYDESTTISEKDRSKT